MVRDILDAEVGAPLPGPEPAEDEEIPELPEELDLEEIELAEEELAEEELAEEELAEEEPPLLSGEEDEVQDLEDETDEVESVSFDFPEEETWEDDQLALLEEKYGDDDTYPSDPVPVDPEEELQDEPEFPEDPGEAKKKIPRIRAKNPS